MHWLTIHRKKLQAQMNLQKITVSNLQLEDEFEIEFISKDEWFTPFVVSRSMKQIRNYQVMMVVYPHNF